MMRRILSLLTGLLMGLAATAASAQSAPQTAAMPRNINDHFFLTSDGVRLHYLEAGPPTAHTLVFVPGWTMPAWIWMPQIQALAHSYHIIAFDPRGQGDSAVPANGYEPVRRGMDVAELIASLKGRRVVVVAWSLGVLDTLASINVVGDDHLAGLVLVDNSVGEEPPPTPTYRPQAPVRRGPPPTYTQRMRAFVRAMFHRPQSPAYLDRLSQATLRTPEGASRLLLAYPVPRSYWREAIYSTRVPVLYAVRPRWVAQGENLVRNRPNTEMEVFSDAGHALFVDEPARFNTVTEQFLRRHVWP